MSGFLRRLSLARAQAGGAWNAVKIGAGGYATGIDQSADGSTRVARTDTAGAFKWDFATSSWKSLVTAASFAGAALDDRGGGVVEIRVAPSDPTRIYMSFQGDVWISRDRGATFTATGLNYSTRSVGQAEANQNAVTRYSGPKMAVDPANPDVVYYGTPLVGVWFTLNGGASWTQIPSATLPFGTTVYPGSAFVLGHAGIAFDPTSATTTFSGVIVTRTLYIPCYGSGVYQTTNGGNSWAELNSSGMPTLVVHGKVAIDGTYYCATNASSSACLYEFNGVWTNISPPGGHNAILSLACDPNDATRLIAMGNDGILRISTSGTWAAQITSNSRSGVIDWLDLATVNNSNPADIMFDVAGTTILQANGLGVFSTPFSGSPSSLAWNTDATIGIENLTPNDVCLPPGNRAPLLAGWDQSVFRITDPTTFSTTHSPTNAGTIIHMAWGIDCAYGTPDFAAYISTWASDPFGWSTTDNGLTWTAVASPVGGNIPIFSGGVAQHAGGCAAVSTPSNFIFAPAGDALPWVTQDGGATWAEIVISGVATSGETGYGHAYFSSCKTAAADRVTANCFYLYNYKTLKTYRSIDGGVTWAKGTSGSGGSTLDTQAIIGNYQLVSVPGHAGNLFLSGGQAGNAGDANPAGTFLQRSTDGGETWARVGAAPNSDGCIKEPYCVCFGVAKAGQSFPAVYFVGWLHVSGAYKFGIWRSFDNCVTWEFLGDYPTQLGAPKSMDASKDVYGLLYTTLGGASYNWRTAD